MPLATQADIYFITELKSRRRRTYAAILPRRQPRRSHIYYTHGLRICHAAIVDTVRQTPPRRAPTKFAREYAASRILNTPEGRASVSAGRRRRL